MLFLNTMDIEELFALMKVTTDNELKENISLVLGKNSSKYSRLNYSSERSSCITSSLDEYYRHLIEELKISDLEFLEDLVFKGLGNNIGYQTGLGKVYETNLVYGDKNVQSFLKENGIDKLWKFINICELGYIREKSQKEKELANKVRTSDIINKTTEEASYFRYLDAFFANEENRVLYEGTFNSYMYIKDYLYRLLALDKTISITQVFDEQRKKVSIAKQYIQEISIYLLGIRSRITDSRLSAFNNKLKFVAKSKPSELTRFQRQYIELVSFGTSLDKLKNKDFSDIERLIYIPKKKI